MDRVAADPANPAAWLFFIYNDGHWVSGSGDHDNVTHEASWAITHEDYERALAYIGELTANNGRKLRPYGLTGNQCTSTAAAIAKKAGVSLDPYVEIHIPESVTIEGRKIRLRRDSIYAKIRFAAPEAMGKAITASSTAKGNRNVVSRIK